MLKEEAKRVEKEGEVPVSERIPEWRVAAIEKVFVDDYSVICDYLQKYEGEYVDPKKRKKGEDPRRLLKTPFNIRQMIDTLKTPDWRKIPPYEFYFTPLQEKLDRSISELARMHKATKLRVRYEISCNDPMNEYMCSTIEQDFIVQQLASNPLKRDQFKFLYEIQDIIYKCALREEFLKLPFNDDKVEEEKLF